MYNYSSGIKKPATIARHVSENVVLFGKPKLVAQGLLSKRSFFSGNHLDESPKEAPLLLCNEPAW